MTEFLNEVFTTGDTAPATGVYQLVGEDPEANDRRDLGRVIRLNEGDTLPSHPDTDADAEWRFIRLSKEEQQLEALY